MLSVLRLCLCFLPRPERLTLLCVESVEDEDEVLTALGGELGDFVDYVGGPEYGHVLLSPLENLAAIEEPLVREKVHEPQRSRLPGTSNPRARPSSPSTRSVNSFRLPRLRNTSFRS